MIIIPWPGEISQHVTVSCNLWLLALFFSTHDGSPFFIYWDFIRQALYSAFYWIFISSPMNDNYSCMLFSFIYLKHLHMKKVPRSHNICILGFEIKIVWAIMPRETRPVCTPQTSVQACGGCQACTKPNTFKEKLEFRARVLTFYTDSLWGCCQYFYTNYIMLFKTVLNG